MKRKRREEAECRTHRTLRTHRAPAVQLRPRIRRRLLLLRRIPSKIQLPRRRTIRQIWVVGNCWQRSTHFRRNLLMSCWNGTPHPLRQILLFRRWGVAAKQEARNRREVLIPPRELVTGIREIIPLPPVPLLRLTNSRHGGLEATNVLPNSRI